MGLASLVSFECPPAEEPPVEKDDLAPGDDGPDAERLPLENEDVRVRSGLEFSLVRKAHPFRGIPRTQGERVGERKAAPENEFRKGFMEARRVSDIHPRKLHVVVLVHEPGNNATPSRVDHTNVSVDPAGSGVNTSPPHIKRLFMIIARNLQKSNRTGLRNGGPDAVSVSYRGGTD